MDNTKPGNFGEINIKSLIKKIYDRKIFFLASLITCMTLAYVYIKTATPTYEVSTSLLIDASGKNRQLGDSKYVDGGVGPINSEKNLYNEIAILKSYALIQQAIKELDFGVSYFSGSTYSLKEQYGYFPFEVEVPFNAPRLHGAKFQIELIDANKFNLSIDAKEFSVSNPSKNTVKEFKDGFEFKKVYSFDEEVSHQYFKFKIKKPDYPIALDDFAEQKLFFQLNSDQGLANQYHEKLKVSQVDIQASILTLSVTGASSKKEIAFLKALSSAFINRELLERDKVAAGKESFIRDQLKNITDSLSIAEKTLEQFKRGASAVDLTRSATNALDQLQTLETDKGQISLSIKYYRSLLKYIEDSDGLDKVVAPSAAGINDPMLSENLIELKRLHSEKSRLEFYKGSKRFDIVLVKEQITNTTNTLKENIRNLINASNLKLRDRSQRIAQFESTINQLPVNEKKLLNFQRESTLYGNMYNYLNQELAKTGIARAENTSDTKVIDKPRQLGDGPVAPQKILILLLAAIIGFLIPLVGIIFSDSSQESITQIDQIERHSRIPLLTQVGAFNNALSTLANYKSDWDKDENFRNLSATLQYMVPDQENNVIGVTSVSQGEGKTFCALNLAVNYAKAGKKTLLIDLNFRNPVLGRGLNLSDVSDLKTYLLDPTCPVEKVTQEHQNIPNLFYIITKNTKNNPHLFLSNIRLNTLVTALKYEYDYIIIDTPAIGVVSDYLLIAKHTDINLFVAKKGVSKIAHLDDLENIIKKGAMKNPFIIFNGSTEKNKSTKKYSAEEKGLEEKKVSKWPINFKKSVS